MKRVLSMLLAIIMVLGMVPVTAFAADPARIYFKVNDFDPETATKGTTFTVTAYLENNPGIATFTNTLTWNKKVVKFNGFRIDEYDTPITEVFAKGNYMLMVSDPAVNTETAAFTAINQKAYNAAGVLYVAEFEIIAENGSLDICLETEDWGSEDVYTIADAEANELNVQLDTSAISDLSFGGPAIPEDAPFTIITTDDGFPLSIEYVGDVEFNYSYVPYYVVTVSDHATMAYITAPKQRIMQDSRDGKYYAMGYAAKLDDWSPVYPGYDYEETAVGPKVIVPFQMEGTDMSEKPVTMRFLSGWDAKATHAFGIEDSANACLGLISFQQEVETYAIKTDNALEGGRVWATNEDGDEITEAAQGDEVYVRYEAAEGYKMKNIGYYHDGEFYHTENAVFNMPDGEVTMTGQFEPIHTCAYTEEVVDPNYLKSDATCTSGAVYYKSCTCNQFESGETAATFTIGEPVDCDYVDGKCRWCEKSEPSAAPELVIPEDAPFTDITTDVGRAISVTKQEEDLTISVWGEKSTGPLYSVVIPEGATKTYVTLNYPINQLMFGTDNGGKPINVSGCYGNVVPDADASADVGENGGYTSFEFTSPDENSTTITVPMELGGKYSLVKPANYDDSYDEEYDEYSAPAYYAAAPKYSNNAPICFFTFEYGTAAGGSEPEACTHPNAADDGNCETAVTCPDCKVVVTAAQTHSFTNYVSDGNATCEADGTKTAKCDHEGCEETHYMIDEGSKLDHSFTNYVSDGNATCKVDGTKTAVCDREGCEQQSSILDEGSKLPHTFTAECATEQYLKSAATCTQKAVYYKSCADCGLTGSETFESGEKDTSNHNFEGGVCTRCETPDPNAPVEPENPETNTLTATMEDGTVLPVKDLGVRDYQDGLSYPFYEITVPEGTEHFTPLVLTYNGTNIECIYNIMAGYPSVPMIFNVPDCPNMISMGSVEEFTGEYVAGFYIVEGDITTEPDNGDDPACGHTETTTAYVTVSGEKHTVTVTCQCGEQISQTIENCVDNDNDRTCDLCGGAVACKHTNTTTNTTKTQVAGTETHTITVTCSCGDKISEITENCVDAAKDGTCDVCGGTVTIPAARYVIFDSAKDGQWGSPSNLSKLYISGAEVVSYTTTGSYVVTLAADTPADAAITFSAEGLKSGNSSGALLVNSSKTNYTVNLVNGGATVEVAAANSHGYSPSTRKITFKLAGVADVPVESIVITPENPKVIAGGGKLQLVANVYPENATIKDVVWSTTAASTAITLTNEGLVMGDTMGVGRSYTITATSVSNPEIKATCEVFLDWKKEDSITISENTLNLTAGETATLSATVSGTSSVTNTTVTWNSSDENVATVANGKVTAVKAGTVTITATSYYGLTATCEVTVEAAVCDHVGTETTTAYEQVAGEERHAVIVKCSCGAPIGEATYENCEDKDKNGACDTCGGAVKVPVTKLTWWVGNDAVTEIRVDAGDVVDAVAGCTPRSTAGNVITFTSADTGIVTVNTPEATADGNGHAYTKFTALKAGQTTVTAVSKDNAEVKAVLTVHVVCPGHIYENGACKWCDAFQPIENLEIKIGEGEDEKVVTDTEPLKLTTGTDTVLNLNVAAERITWVCEPDDVAEVVFENNNWVLKALKAGTAVIKAYENTAVAFAIDDEGTNEPQPLATFTVQVTAAQPDTGDQYGITMDGSKVNVVGETIVVELDVFHGEHETYNAYQIEFTYDNTIVELLTTGSDGEGKDFTVTDNDGSVIITRYGEATSEPIKLTFKAVSVGQFDLELTDAKISNTNEALDKDADKAAIVSVEGSVVEEGTTNIQITNYTVDLHEAFEGNSTVAPGADYTFKAKDPNYDYALTVKVTDPEKGEVDITSDVTIEGNSYTIPSEFITGNIRIDTEATPKTFAVTLNGESLSHDSGYATADDGTVKVTYKQNYTAKLTKKENTAYNVEVLVNNAKIDHLYDEATGIITVPGELITGDVVVKSNEASTVDLSVTFTGLQHIPAETPRAVKKGGTYSFTLAPAAGYKDYVVSYALGTVDENTQFTVLTAVDGTYTIESVQDNLTIKIEASTDLEVEVTEYVTRDGEQIFLVTATQTLPEGQALSYGDAVMYFTHKYDSDTVNGVWTYLVSITSGSFDADIAKAQIKQVAPTSFTTVEQTFNVNKSNQVDINDAQLVYDMYKPANGHAVDGTTMEKFLLGDVNADTILDVKDAAAVVDEILPAN